LGGGDMFNQGNDVTCGRRENGDASLKKEGVKG